MWLAGYLSIHPSNPSICFCLSISNNFCFLFLAQHDPMYVKVLTPTFTGSTPYRAGPAQFGYDLKVSPPVIL